MLGALVIVFREAIEAGLIVGIVLAATKGVAHRNRWVSLGVAGGVLGASLVAAFAGEIGAMFQGNGQELFNAGVLLLAVLMLTWHNVWMASHGREMSAQLKRVGAAVVAGERTLLALAIVVGVAVLREGSEVVLFLYGIASQGGTSRLDLLVGGTLGLLCGAGVAVLMYRGLLRIPASRLFAITSALITLLAAGMASQAVAFLQQGGYFQHLMEPIWDTSWLLPENWILGKMLHTLIGYSEAPDGAQLIAYAATIAAIVLLMRMVDRAKPRDRMPEAHAI